MSDQIETNEQCRPPNEELGAEACSPADFVAWMRAEMRSCGGIGKLCDKHKIATGVSASASAMIKAAVKYFRPDDWRDVHQLFVPRQPPMLATSRANTESWVATVDGVFDRREMASKDVREAACQAKAMLQVELEAAISELGANDKDLARRALDSE